MNDNITAALISVLALFLLVGVLGYKSMELDKFAMSTMAGLQECEALGSHDIVYKRECK